MCSSIDFIEKRLDQLEERLPAIPAASLRLQRSIGQRTMSVMSEMFSAWQESARTAFGATTESAKTVATATRSAGEDVVDVVGASARRVVSETEDEGREAYEAVADEMGDAAEAGRQAGDELRSTTMQALEAVDQVVDPDHTPTGESFQTLTKQQLYDRAAKQDIAGRSKMSKQELIDALTDAA